MPATDPFSQRLEEALRQQRAQRQGAARRSPQAGPADSAAATSATRAAGPAGGAAANPTSAPLPADDFAQRLIAERTRTAPVNGAPGLSDAPQSPAPTPAGPVGTGAYVVKQGDCLASIAQQFGHLWQRIWDDPANAELRNVRKDSRVLLPGDRLAIPEKQQKHEPGQTEMRHRFQLKGRPDRFTVRVLRDGEPRGNEKFELEVDGETHRGVTQADGLVVCRIMPDARRARLVVGEGENQQEFRFLLGGIDPITEISGVQQRLRNLGFDCGEVDGKLGPHTRDALRAYQQARGLNETGEADEATRDRLQSDYGC